MPTSLLIHNILCNVHTNKSLGFVVVFFFFLTVLWVDRHKSETRYLLSGTCSPCPSPWPPPQRCVTMLWTFHIIIVGIKQLLPGGGNGNPLQYSCLENPMDSGSWLAIVHGVAKSWTRLSNCLETVIYAFWIKFHNLQCIIKVN